MIYINKSLHAMFNKFTNSTKYTVNKYGQIWQGIRMYKHLGDDFINYWYRERLNMFDKFINSKKNTIKWICADIAKYTFTNFMVRGL